MEIEQGGTVSVAPLNKPSGHIWVQVDGDITVNGKVSNSLSGTNGTPGGIMIASQCGTIRTGPMSLIQTVGQDHGGGDISLVSGGDC